MFVSVHVYVRNHSTGVCTFYERLTRPHIEIYELVFFFGKSWTRVIERQMSSRLLLVALSLASVIAQETVQVATGAFGQQEFVQQPGQQPSGQPSFGQRPQFGQPPFGQAPFGQQAFGSGMPGMEAMMQQMMGGMPGMQQGFGGMPQPMGGGGYQQPYGGAMPGMMGGGAMPFGGGMQGMMQGMMGGGFQMPVRRLTLSSAASSAQQASEAHLTFAARSAGHGRPAAAGNARNDGRRRGGGNDERRDAGAPRDHPAQAPRLGRPPYAHPSRAPCCDRA